MPGVAFLCGTRHQAVACAALGDEMLDLDHLAVAAENLADGVASVEQALGVKLVAGGLHAHMGTHNMLLRLGDVYLEVIAINPEAPPPAHPRWFDLDHFQGPARLTNWICRCDDLDRAVAASPPGVGQPVALSRGELRWKMAVPENGKLPFAGAFPALIQWQGRAHPAALLPESGCRLLGLEITHPEAQNLSAALAPLLDEGRVTIAQGPAVSFHAVIDTPHGARDL